MSNFNSNVFEGEYVPLESQELQPLIRRQSASRVMPIAIFTFYGALIAGTGGVFETNNIPRLSEWTNFPVIQVQVRGKEQRQDVVSVSSMADLVRGIRDTFGLKMSELAQIFGVSRQATYDWLDGSVPRVEIANRIWELSRAAQQLDSAGITRIEHFLHRPMLAGDRSLFSLLLTGDNIEDAIAHIKDVAKAEAERRSSTTNRNTGTSGGDASEIYNMGTPILSEGKES